LGCSPNTETKLEHKKRAPFHESGFLPTEHKRRLSSALVPEIHVKNYRLLGFFLLTDTYRIEMTHTAAGNFIATPAKLYIPLPENHSA
jgi:hypothetical protein